MNQRWRNTGLYPLLVIVVILATALLACQPQNTTTWRYSQFVDRIKAGQVEKVNISADRSRALVTTNDGQQVVVDLPADPELINILQTSGVAISVSPQTEDNVWARVLSTLLIPFLLPMVGLLVGLILVLRYAR